MGSNDSLENAAANINPFAGGSRGPTRSTVSGQSVSTSGSAGSPSTRSDNTFLRLNHVDVVGDDDAGSQGVAGKKKKRAQRATGGDKGGRGLRQFSMKVCEKVESKGRTTYNEVADELVAEFSDPGDGDQAPDQKQYDEKNIRRRVYDALNVLMAMDIISKDKKEIQWRGLPRTSLNDIEELKSERLALKNRIEKKKAYLGELEDQRVGLQNLIKRNEQLYSSGNTPSGGVALPFILVQTRPHATVEVEISEDMQLVHFDFNSTPFELHDDNYVLKAMKLGNGPNTVCTDGGAGSSMLQPQVPLPPRSTVAHGRPPPSPPLPGILKGRVKYEH
ncbi:putative transcription factor E2F-DP family [Helianthus annuus]|nr:putative transcription factor E2F-DP family [Helianthus annuus]